MSHAHFTHLLSLALVPLTPAEKNRNTPSVCSGIPSAPRPWKSSRIAVSESAFRAPLAKTWAREWVRRIEDVTARARELKGVLDQEGVEELVRRGVGSEGGGV